MKKLTILIAAAALVCFSVPAMAVDWNFYGSARMATFWSSEDSGDNGSEINELYWEWQNNSRIGATVKADHLRGRFELGLKSVDSDDEAVGTRRLEGEWNFGSGSLMVAKGYSPLNQFISGQVARGDAGLLGRGFLYAGRPGFLQLAFGGFKVALISPKTADLGTDPSETQRLPKVEASWGMAYDAFNFNVMGGAQTYKLKDVESLTNPGDDDDIDVTSYVIGADGGFNFGPAYVKVGGSYAVNGGNANWTAGAGEWDDDDDINDNKTWQAGIVAGMKVSDMLSFEGGFGYRQDDLDDADEKQKTWEVYAQSVILLAPGVYIIPEVGYYDHGKDVNDDDLGDDYYLGAKWQIDF